MSYLSVKPLALAALLSCHLLVHATQPAGHRVVNGSATVNSFGNGLQVINSPGAILHWDSFSISAGQTVRFDQLTANSAVLNRVTGGRASEIFGTLQSNGRVFLINPNGLLFGKGSKVDTAGFLASTLDISNDDFLSGNYRFNCANTVACEAGVDVLNPINGRIVLQDGSEITTRQSGNGGQVWLIARDRITSEKGSRIDVPGGQVIAATAREVSVSSPSVGQMRFTLTGATSTRIDLAGDIDVARGAAGFFADTVRLAGRVSALSEQGAAGQIVVQAATDVLIDDDARLSVSGIDGADAGAIRVTAGRTVKVAASTEVTADGANVNQKDQIGRGGLIDITAAEVILPPRADANSPNHGYPAWPSIHAAGGTDRQGLESENLAGLVKVTETGSFEFVSQTIASHGNSISSDLSSEKFFVQRLSGTQVTVNSFPAATDGHGNFAIRRDVVSEYNEFGVAVATQFVDFYRSSGELIGSVEFNGLASAAGLSKGGWVFTSDAGPGNNDRMVKMLDANLHATLNLYLETSKSVALRDIDALIDGGISLVTMDEKEVKQQFYDAKGHIVKTSTYANLEEYQRLGRTPSLGIYQSAKGSVPSVVLGDTGRLELTYLAPNQANNKLLAELSPPTPGGASLESGSHYTDLLGYFNDTALVHDYLYTQSSVSGGVISSNQSTLQGSVGFAANGNYTPLFTSTAHTSRVDERLCADCEDLKSSQSSLALNNQVSSASAVGGNQFVVAQFDTAGDHLNNNTNIRVLLLTRQLTSHNAPIATEASDLFVPALLATAPGLSNGAVSLPSNQGTGSDTSGSGNAGSNTSPSTSPSAPSGPVGLSLPPPPAPITAVKAPAASNKPGSGIEASIITNPSGTDGRQELLDAAADVVEHELGKAMADKFREAKTAQERGVILQEAADAQVLGRELYDIVKDMDPEMSDALFEGWSVLQQAGLEQEPGVSEGLLSALTIKRDGGTNEDGSPGVPRTALEVPLSILRAEMHQARTPEEKARVRNLMTRELLLAAREEAGKEADDTADVVLTDVAGKKTRITPQGELIRE